MEIPLRRLPPMGMVFALFCFFLPFMTLSCPGGRYTFSGLDLAIGTTIEEPQLFGKPAEKKIAAEPLATGALGLTALAALIGLAAGRMPRVATASIAGLNILLLLILKSRLEKQSLSQAGGVLEVSWGPGYWLALAAYVTTIAVVVLILRATSPPGLPTRTVASTE